MNTEGGSGKTSAAAAVVSLSLCERIAEIQYRCPLFGVFTGHG